MLAVYFSGGGAVNLELQSLSIVDPSIRDGLLVDLLELVQLLRCCLPQLHGLHSLLHKQNRTHIDTHSEAFM